MYPECTSKFELFTDVFRVRKKNKLVTLEPHQPLCCFFFFFALSIYINNAKPHLITEIPAVLGPKD